MLSSSSLFVLVFLSTLKLVLILADSSKGVDQVCYGTLGCFTPLDDPRFPLYPGTPSDVGTTFRLYHQKDPRRYVNIHYEANGVKRQVDPGTVIGKKILGTSKIVLIIHGWMVNHDYELYQELRQALFKVSEWVIAVDWRKGAENPYYPQSVANTALVGRATALLIRRLSRCCNILTSNVHIIGFSLGAHAAGNAGRWFNAQFNEKIGRISALDGAGVLLKNSTLGLNPSDALFVDAIHTSGGDDMEALIGQLGNPHSIGHVDFYPNGGREQTHCLHNPQEISPFCNHHAAIEYYISSLITCEYRAHQCESWTDYLAGKCQDPHKEARMGYYSFSTNLRGNFYISTQSASPFCESTDHKVCPSRPFWLANALTNLVAGTHNAIAFFFPTNSNKSRIWFQ